MVQSFLAGEGGVKLLARRWSVFEEKVRTWVNHYRLRGINGLSPKRSVYSDAGQVAGAGRSTSWAGLAPTTQGRGLLSVHERPLC